MSSASLNVQAC